MPILPNEALQKLALGLIHLFGGHEAPVRFIKCKRLLFFDKIILAAIPRDKVQLRIVGQGNHGLNVRRFP